MAVEVVIRAEAAEASRVVEEFRGRLGGLRGSTAQANDELRRGHQVFRGFTSVLSAVSQASGVLGQEQSQVVKTLGLVEAGAFTAATAMRGLDVLTRGLGQTMQATGTSALVLASRIGLVVSVLGVLALEISKTQGPLFEWADWVTRLFPRLANLRAVEEAAIELRRRGIARLREEVEARRPAVTAAIDHMQATDRATEAAKREAEALAKKAKRLREEAKAREQADIAVLIALANQQALEQIDETAQQRIADAAAARLRLEQETADLIALANIQAIEAIEQANRERLEEARRVLAAILQLEQETAELIRLANQQTIDRIEQEERERIAEGQALLRGLVDGWAEAAEALEKSFDAFLSSFLQGSASLADLWRTVVRIIADQWIQTLRLMLVQQKSFELAAAASFGNIQNAALAAFALVANFAVGKKKRAAEDARRAATEQARKVEELLREVAQVAQGALQAAFSSNVFFTMERAWEQFTLRLRQDLFRRIQEGIIQALLRTAVLQAAMQPLLEALRGAVEEATATGVFDPAKFAARLGPAINLFNAMIGRFQPIFAAAFALLRQIGFGLGVFAGPNPFAGFGFPPAPGPPPLPPPGPPRGPRDFDRPEFGGGQMVVVEAIHLNGPMMASDAEARFFARQIMRLIRQEAARA